MTGQRSRKTPTETLRLLILLWLMLWLTACAGPQATDVADGIQARYEAELPTLSLTKQRHYAQRLYRISGDPRYMPPNQRYAERLLNGLNDDLRGLDRPGYAATRSQQLVADYAVRTEKQRARKRMLGEWGEIAFARDLLFRLVQLEYYQLLDVSDPGEYAPALEYLATVDFDAFLTDPGVLAIYAAQVANIVHFLHQLGIDDLRDETVSAFRERYPPARDAALPKAEYHNKLYGMTHFVIAASRYYQQPVSDREFAWILAEFEAGLPRILATTEDIYTEVGLSFLLAGKRDHPAVARIRDALLRAYDPRQQMIPSSRGGFDLARGQHRNVLAILFLRWPERLYPGPDLSSVLVPMAPAAQP